MALSGTISGSYRGYTLQTLWTASQNVAGNYSDITATHRLVCASTYALYISSRTNSCSIDGTTKNFTSPAISTGGGQTITLGTTTQRVYHNADGTKSFAIKTIFNMQAEIAGTWVSSITATGTVTLDRIPRQATITNANNFNDEQNPSFSFSNAGGFSMTAYLQYGSAKINRTVGSASSGTYTFVLTEAERNALRNATPNSPTLSVIYGLQTTISGSVYTNTATRTMTIVNANPTAVTLTYSDTNSTTVAITGDNQRIIQNKSILTAVIGSSTAKKGATIKTYSTTINGVTVAGNGTKNMGVVNLSQNGTLTTTVTDSRGFKTSTSVTVTIDAWQNPSAIVTLYRINNFETSSRLKVDGSFSSLNGQNTLNCEYATKRADQSTWSNWTTIANRTLETINLDNLYEWTVKVRIKDRLSDYIEYFATIGKGIPIMFIDTDKRSVGFNCFPTGSETVEVNGSPIVESGSNSNGNYVKFYDGTMICWNYEEVTDQAINSQYGTTSLYIGNRQITYPVAFVSKPVLTCSIFKWGTSGSWASTSDSTTPLTKGMLRGYDFYSRPTGENCQIGWHAIGKWK